MQSRLTEILLIILGIVVVCFLGFWIWSWATRPATSVPTTTSTSGTQFPSQVSVGVSSSTVQSPPAQQSTPDIESAYANFFVQVGSSEATFVQADASSTGDLGNLYALYAKDVAISQKVSPGAPDYSVGVDLTDLNSDGVNEALVLEDLPGFCGTEGCTLDIYQKQGSSWNKIFSTTVEGNVGLSNVYVDGYQNLLLTINVGGPDSQIVTYSWNGMTYIPGQAVATWNGSIFQAIQ